MRASDIEEFHDTFYALIHLASPSFTQDDTLMPEPTQPMPTFNQTCLLTLKPTPDSGLQYLIMSQGNSPTEVGKMQKEIQLFIPPVSLDVHWLLLQRKIRIEEVKKTMLKPAVAEVSVTEEKKAYIRVMTGFLEDSEAYCSLVSQTYGRSDNVMECVLHSFVAGNEHDSKLQGTKAIEITISADCQDLTERKVTADMTDEPKALSLRWIPWWNWSGSCRAEKHDPRNKVIPSAVDIQTLPESDVENSTLNGSDRKATDLLVDQISAGWLYPAARPFFRPPLYIIRIGYSLRNIRPHFGDPKSNAGSRNPPWFTLNESTKQSSSQNWLFEVSQVSREALSNLDGLAIVRISGKRHPYGLQIDFGKCLTMLLSCQHFNYYAEELAKLQRQEYEAKDAAARYGYLFSQATAEILCQAEAEIRNQGVSAVKDPAGIDSAVREPAGIVSADGVSTGSPSADSDPAGSNPADCFPPAGSVEPTDESNPAVSSSVSADFNPVYADESTLPPGQQLGSSENTTRFPVPSDVCMDQISSGIFTSSSYDDDFRATLTNLAPAVEVNPVPTKRVNTIHPQSQILGDLASPVMTRSRAQKSKFGESAFIGYIQDQQRTNHTDFVARAPLTSMYIKSKNFSLFSSLPGVLTPV
ncbi:hypothetical protein Tco_0927713, partial [Tanacetum coccineum]